MSFQQERFRLQAERVSNIARHFFLGRRGLTERLHLGARREEISYGKYLSHFMLLHSSIPRLLPTPLYRGQYSGKRLVFFLFFLLYLPHLHWAMQCTRSQSPPLIFWLLFCTKKRCLKDTSLKPISGIEPVLRFYDLQSLTRNDVLPYTKRAGSSIRVD